MFYLSLLTILTIEQGQFLENLKSRKELKLSIRLKLVANLSRMLNLSSFLDLRFSRN